MANKICTVKTTFTYTDEDGNTRTASNTVAAPYQAFAEGSLDVPDATVDSTAFDIPFGSVAKASVLEIVNKTGQEMTLKLNGSSALTDVPNGAVVTIAAAALPAGTAITAASLTTTDTQSGAGTIAFRIFGDSV